MKYGSIHILFFFSIFSIASLMSLTHKEALDILELQDPVTTDSIAKQFRKLSIKWHPDKFINTTEKAEAEEKYKDLGIARDLLEKELASSSKSDAQREKENKQKAEWMNELWNLVTKLVNRTASLKNLELKAEVKDIERALFQVKQGGITDKAQYEDFKNTLLDLETKIIAAENQKQPSPQQVATYSNYQEAVDAVVMGYPFNKKSVSNDDYAIWGNTLATLKDYIKKEVNITRGFFNVDGVSAENKKRLEKAQQEIGLATTALIAVKRGADKNQLKTVAEKLKLLQKNELQILSNDSKTTKNLKELLSMIAAKLENTSTLLNK